MTATILYIASIVILIIGAMGLFQIPAGIGIPAALLLAIFSFIVTFRQSTRYRIYSRVNASCVMVFCLALILLAAYHKHVVVLAVEQHRQAELIAVQNHK
jgi:Mn2+/Fe2+ NRAMP family transporter